MLIIYTNFPQEDVVRPSIFFGGGEEDVAFKRSKGCVVQRGGQERWGQGGVVKGAWLKRGQ